MAEQHRFKGHFWVPLRELEPHIAVASQLEMHLLVSEFLQMFGVKPHCPAYCDNISMASSSIQDQVLTELQQLPSEQGKPGPH